MLATWAELGAPAVLLRTRLAPDHRTGRCPASAPLHGASRLPEVGQTCERTSAGDPSGTQHACRGSAEVEEAAAERGSAAMPEQCCSGWPSSASGAERTAPESRVEASASRYPGCSAPAAGPNRNRCSWCSPSDLNKRCMSKDIAEITSDGYDIFLQERLRHDKVDMIEWIVLPPTI